LIYRWIKKAGLALPEPSIAHDIKEIEFDEIWHFLLSKNKIWIIKAVDRCTRRTIAWVIGGGNAANLQRLYNKVKHLNNCTFSTDDWDAFSSVLSQNRHVVGKSGTRDD